MTWPPRVVDLYKEWPPLHREQREWGMVVGRRVRKLRQARGWTLDRLSENVHRPDGRRYSVTTFSRLERGSAGSPLYVYLQLADALGIAPGRLLGEDEALLEVSAAEMTLLATARELGIAPHEALAQLIQARSTAMRSSSPSM
jgi:transcriptional regulator with XRE-family HTH domain